MNLLLEKSKYVEYYTYLDDIFEKIPEFRQYFWVISDLETNNTTDPRLKKTPVSIEGNSLFEIIKKEKIQFIWAVLSGFKEKPSTLPNKLPYADNNPNLWVGSPKPQAPGAEMEIVCWDSTCTLFIGINEIISSKLKEIYPDIKNLDEENEKKG